MHVTYSRLKDFPAFDFYPYGDGSDGNHGDGDGGVLYCSGVECNAPLTGYYNIVVNFTGNGDGQNIYLSFVLGEYE